MKAPPWYPEWADEAFDHLRAKQARLNEDYGIGAFDRYDYNLDAGFLTFSGEAGPKVIAAIQVVGTTSSKNWLWGWANSHWPVISVEDMPRVREYGVDHGIQELTEEFGFGKDLTGLGWRFTAVAVRLLDAVGAYRPSPTERGSIFLLIRSIRFVS